MQGKVLHPAVMKINRVVDQEILSKEMPLFLLSR
jgi:hypothetical protein